MITGLEIVPIVFAGYHVAIDLYKKMKRLLGHKKENELAVVKNQRDSLQLILSGHQQRLNEAENLMREGQHAVLRLQQDRDQQARQLQLIQNSVQQTLQSIERNHERSDRNREQEIERLRQTHGEFITVIQMFINMVVRLGYVIAFFLVVLVVFGNGGHFTHHVGERLSQRRYEVGVSDMSVSKGLR
jgi:sirohydrochlorin ferrochelatase